MLITARPASADATPSRAMAESTKSESTRRGRRRTVDVPAAAVDAAGATTTAPAAAASATSTSAPTPTTASKKAVPSLPFRVRMRYGIGALPASSDALLAGGLDDACASSGDLPLCPAHLAQLRADLVVLLRPAHRRSDVGALLSALRTLQVDSHYLLAWRLRGAPERTVAGVAYPSLRLSLWSNSSVPSNLQLVGLQRHALSRLPANLASCFGSRDMNALIRAAVLGAYAAAGLPTAHEPVANTREPAANELKHLALNSPHTLAALLTAVQNLAQAADPQQLDQLFPCLSAAAASSSSDAPAAASSLASPAIAPAESDLASLAPPLPALPPAEPLRIDASLPLLSQFSRGFCGVLSLLKKSAAFIVCLEVQRQDESRMGVHAIQRHMLCEMQGCDFPSFYAFLQHRLPLPSPPASTTDASSASHSTDPAHTDPAPASPLDATAAASFLREMSALSPALSWLNLTATSRATPATTAR